MTAFSASAPGRCRLVQSLITWPNHTSQDTRQQQVWGQLRVSDLWEAQDPGARTGLGGPRVRRPRGAGPGPGGSNPAATRPAPADDQLPCLGTALRSPHRQSHGHLCGLCRKRGQRPSTCLALSHTPRGPPGPAFSTLDAALTNGSVGDGAAPRRPGRARLALPGPCPRPA